MSKVYMLGGAQTDFERNWTKEGKNVIALLSEIISDTLESVDLDYNDIKRLNAENRIGCYVGNFIGEKYVDQGHLGALLTMVNPAFYGVPSARYEAACASSSVAMKSAIADVQSGTYDVAIVVGWELMKTVDSKTGGDYLGRAAYYETEGKGIDFPFPQLFGRLADALIDRYSMDQDKFLHALAVISAKNYANAKRNPLAQTRSWFMNVEQANMRGTATNANVGGLLAISDCSQVTDGAAAVVFVSESYAKKIAKKLPVIKGFGHRVAPMLFSEKIADGIYSSSDYILPWTRQAVLDAYRRANLTVDDMDFFETHDCFTSSEYAAVSSFGICKPGEEIEVIENGITQIDGRFPINTSGGLIGCGHPVGASGARMMLDLYRQVTGTANGYQLSKARNGMMLNIGGSATTNYTFILGEE